MEEAQTQPQQHEPTIYVLKNVIQTSFCRELLTFEAC